MATTFKHRKISNDKRESIAEKLASEMLGPKPDQSHIPPRIQAILDQVHALIMADPSREEWFKLPQDFRDASAVDHYSSPWKNKAPDFRELLSGIDSGSRFEGIDNYNMGRMLERMDNVGLDDLDFYYFDGGSSNPTLLHWLEYDNTRTKFIVPFVDQDKLSKHTPSRTIDGNTIVKDHNGTDVSLYRAVAALMIEYTAYEVNYRKLSNKLINEMEDCTTKQVIEAWPQAEQLIYDAYGFQPNVSKPTAPLSQVLADAGILQIAAQ